MASEVDGNGNSDGTTCDAVVVEVLENDDREDSKALRRAARLPNSVDWFRLLISARVVVILLSS